MVKVKGAELEGKMKENEMEEGKPIENLDSTTGKLDSTIENQQSGTPEKLLHENQPKYDLRQRQINVVPNLTLLPRLCRFSHMTQSTDSDNRNTFLYLRHIKIKSMKS